MSIKDSEGDPTYDYLLAIECIASTARDAGINRLVLVGAPSELASTLQSRFGIEQYGSSRPEWAIHPIRALLSRARHLVHSLRDKICCLSVVPVAPATNVIAGFWDWSVRGGDGQSLQDRYFKRVVEVLKRQSRLSWAAWFEPHLEPGSENRSAMAVAKLARRHNDVVLLQSFVRLRDILTVFLDLRGAWVYLRLRRSAAFRTVLVEDQVDYFPLFDRRLLYGFLNGTTTRYDLVARAARRYFTLARPENVLTFLEHFPHGRAISDAANHSTPKPNVIAMQHASYQRDKTILHFESAREFLAPADTCPAPHPDIVFTMGTLGAELFRECGYDSQQVIQSGSARYEHVRLIDRPGPEQLKPTVLLMVSTLNLDREREMVEAAAGAFRGDDSVKLRFRNHPYRRVQSAKWFAEFTDVVEISAAALEEDLASAHVVLFTYSTVAEEAVLAGKPVWQWLTCGFDGSALAGIGGIQRFSTMHGLREAVRQFQSDPGAMQPDESLRRQVANRLFEPALGASDRIAARIMRGSGADESKQSERSVAHAR